MSLRWFFRLTERTNVALPPLVLLGLGALVYGGLLQTDGGFVRAELAPRQLVGTLVLFVLLPAYLTWVLPLQRRRTEHTLREIAPLAREGDVARVRGRLDQLPRWSGALIVLGVLFGLYQNPVFLAQIFESGRTHPLDVAFIAGAAGLWVFVAVLLAWRLPISAALSRLGEHVRADVYRLNELRPLGRYANTDILMVAGAMALSPLQSLDAEFRMGNYWPTVLVGLPAAALLFLLPLWGVRNSIRQAKRTRIADLEKQLDTIDRGDIERLEAHAAHLERVRGLSDWPLDFELATRLFGYVIIPPLAWVAAALVERFIDQL